MIPASCLLFLFLDNCSREFIHPSIHGLGCRGSSLSRCSIFLSHLLWLFWWLGYWGFLKSAERHILSAGFWVYHGGFSQLDSCPGGILYSCHDHLSWLLPMWKSTSSTLSPSQMTKVLNMSLKESSAFCLGKLKSAAWKLMSASISLFWLLLVTRGHRWVWEGMNHP